MEKKKILVEIELETEIGSDYLTSAVKGAILHNIATRRTIVKKIDVRTYNTNN